MEYVNVSGLRVDGRRPHEVRRVRCRLGLFGWADGSTLFEQGNTKVLAVVHGPRELQRRSEGSHDAAVLHVEYSMAPFAASERRRRRVGDRRNVDAATAVRQSLACVIDAQQYPRSAIDISLYVLQADGGVLAASINAATLALIDAGIAVRDFVVGCSVVYIGKTALLDPNFVEASSGGAEMALAITPSDGKCTLCTMEARLPLEALEVRGQGGEWARAHSVMELSFHHTRRLLPAAAQQANATAQPCLPPTSRAPPPRTPFLGDARAGDGGMQGCV